LEKGLSYLGKELESKTNQNPCDNTGAFFENEVFRMSSYCWCEGEAHKDGCPPNFLHKKSGFSVSWYKYLGRGTESDEISDKEFRIIMQECLVSLNF
jgi:hypothetical protein